VVSEAGDSTVKSYSAEHNPLAGAKGILFEQLYDSPPLPKDKIFKPINALVVVAVAVLEPAPSILDGTKDLAIVGALDDTS
jgi:hypothetical protein